MSNFRENPPDDWEECECCGGYHPPMPVPTKAANLYFYDCRYDKYRWPSEASIAYLESKKPERLDIEPAL